MIDLDEYYKWANNPQHYQCPFKLKAMTCDFFVGLLPFYLGCALNMFGALAAKKGESLERDLLKALECLKLWNDVEDGWRLLAPGQDYPNQLYLMHAFKCLLRAATENTAEQWRMDALEWLLDGSWASARGNIEARLERQK